MLVCRECRCVSLMCMNNHAEEIKLREYPISQVYGYPNERIIHATRPVTEVILSRGDVAPQGTFVSAWNVF